VLQSEPRNVDALLGLATIEQQQHNGEAASKYYLRVLDFEPKNAYAQAGLIGLVGRADPDGAESRLKQLIAREPSAYLYFTLGNLYAERSLWAQAQSAYFQAYNMQPDNPDYAYNLAIGLERVSQPGIAVGFYRKAVQSAKNKGHASFEPGVAEERIRKLEAAAKE
jgi:tetratricopeptide (TPR) repeat protein